MRQTFLALNVKASQRFEAMSSHHARVLWERGAAPFTYEGYVRDHRIFFGANELTQLEASAAQAYRGNPALPNPEDELVASLSSCHMLTFLAIACKKKFVLDEYIDEAVGHMEKNAEGRLAITRVVLRQKAKFSGDKQPTAQELDEMNHTAHEQCFIANSVKTEITVEPQK